MKCAAFRNAHGISSFGLQKIDEQPPEKRLEVVRVDPRSGQVKGINALGVAPTGATVEFFRSKGMRYPPEFGPLAAVTPGTPGGLSAVAGDGQASLSWAASSGATPGRSVST